MRCRRSTIPCSGKLIAWGESRAQAVDTLHRALGELEIVGVTTNRALLQSVLADAEFRARRRSPRIFSRRGVAHLSFGEPQPDAVRTTCSAALWYATAAMRRRARSGRIPPAGDLAARGRHALALRRAMGDASSASARSSYRGCASRTRTTRCASSARERALRSRSEIARQPRAVRASSSRSATSSYFRTGRHTSLRAAQHRGCAAGRPTEADAGSLVTPLPGTVVAVHVAVGAKRRARRAAHHDRGDENGAHRGGALRGHRSSGCRSAWRDRVAAGAVLVELQAAATDARLADELEGRGRGGERRQGDLEAGLVAEQARERDLAAGLVHVAPHQGRPVPCAGSPGRVRQRRVAGLEDELDALAIAQARGVLAGEHAACDGGRAHLLGIEAAAIVLEQQLEAAVRRTVLNSSRMVPLGGLPALTARRRASRCRASRHCG